MDVDDLGIDDISCPLCGEKDMTLIVAREHDCQKTGLTDDEVLQERAKIYGPVEPMWETIGCQQWLNFMYLFQTCADRGRDPTPGELGHLGAMNMNVVKMVRSIRTPEHPDNYVDGRNYWTIGGMMVKKNE
tara:strand:+ start:747 stop:1139 length:393 start_codon:yes stop_codon:yes gene_type:complete